MNRQELFRLARREVEHRRQQAETKAMRRREEIYRAVPELLSLEREINEAGALAAQLATDGQPQAAKGKLEQMNTLSQKRQAVLKDLRITPQELVPQYHCKLCNDTGKNASETCACVVEEVKRLRREEINQAGPLTLSSFETFSLDRYPEKEEGLAFSPRYAMDQIFRDCRDYVADFGPKSQSLFLYGDAGLGKTHLALAIANEILNKGFDVIYVSAQNAFSQIMQDRWEGGGELFYSMLEADLLVLDDLGTEYIDAYVLSKLYELVNTRMFRRPTIYTTNVCRQDLLHQRYTEKIASRLLGECHLMRFFGQDIRLSNA